MSIALNTRTATGPHVRALMPCLFGVSGAMFAWRWFHHHRWGATTMEFNRIRAARWHRVFGGPKRVRLLTAGIVVAASGAIIFAAFSEARALQAPSGGKPGLKGILPKEVPADLGADSFTVLNGAWEKWGKDLSGLVTKLYTDDKLDAAGQRELLKQLEGKIHTMDKALSDSRYASLGDAIA